MIALSAWHPHLEHGPPLAESRALLVIALEALAQAVQALRRAVAGRFRSSCVCVCV